MLVSRATVAILLLQAVVAFQPSRPVARSFGVTLVELSAKTNKKGRGGSKGFGKVEEKEEIKPSVPVAESKAPIEVSGPPKGAFLQSVEGGTDSRPELEDLPPEERTKQLLRQKYGMKTLEEQQANEKQMQQLKAQQKRLAELKKKAELDQDIDIIAMIPAPVLKGLDTFLKAGVAISGSLFILAGFGITAEAWSKASGQALPEDIDNFIVNVVEPYFTPGLLVVLGFSVSLGVLAAASLGSEGAQYRQKE